METREVRAGSDPTLFRNDRVARGLHLKEGLGGAVGDYFARQEEVRPHMRRTVAEWMLDVCHEEQCQPEVLCLAVGCLDRFLDIVNIKKSQLQLLGCACLLVAWKVREHNKITAQKIIKYTNFNVTLEELLEWEVLVLAKLNWNIPSVVAIDFVEHIVQNLEKLRLDWNPEMTRDSIRSLILTCQTSPQLARYPPSLVASACVLVTIRPIVEMPPPRLETPSPSSISSCSSTSSPEVTRSSSTHPHSPVTSIPARTSPFRSPDPHPPRAPVSDMDRIVRSIQKITFVEKPLLHRCMDEVLELTRDPLPPSPSPEGLPLPIPSCSTPDLSSSPIHPSSDFSSSGLRFSTSSPLPHAARTLFSDMDSKTPTKLIEAASSLSKI